MKIFGMEIKRAKVDDKISRVSVPAWSAGIQHVTPENYEAMVNAYRSWVYVCANKNALTVAQQNLRLYVAKPSKTTKLLHPSKALSKDQKQYLNSLHTVKRLKSVMTSEDIEEVVDHPIIDMLQNVNPFMNQFDLWELSTVFQELTGNAYWYIVKNDLGTPEQIWVIPAQYMAIVPGKDEFIAGYIYTNGTDHIPFGTDEIIQFKYANPKDMFYGMSPLSAVTDAYNTNQNIATFTNTLFTNMARPEGALYTEQKLNDDDFKRLKEQWNSAYGGAAKANKTAVLTKGLKYEPITMKPKELDYMEGRAWVKEEICNAYGQSVALYSQKANRANAEQAYRSFLRDTITPRLRRYEEKINEKLMPLFDEHLFVAFDSAVPEDKIFVLKERESNLKTGYTSINQERVKNGDEPVEWGDIPLMPMNTMPIGGQTQDETPEKFIIRRVLEKIRS